MTDKTNKEEVEIKIKALEDQLILDKAELVDMVKAYSKFISDLANRLEEGSYTIHEYLLGNRAADINYISSKIMGRQKELLTVKTIFKSLTN